MVEVKYLTSATAVFMNLQSGLARPYWEVNITVSGDASTTTATLGQAYAANNNIISMGSIDRTKPVLSSGLSRIVAGDVTLTLDDRSGTYSPLHTGSIFADAGGSARDYLHSIINIWAGFENTSGTAYVVQRGSFLLTKLETDGQNRTTRLTAEDRAKIPLERYLGLPDISGTASVWYPLSGINTKAIMTEMLSAIGFSSTQYSLASALDFPDFSIQEGKIGEQLAKLAQANI